MHVTVCVHADIVGTFIERAQFTEKTYQHLI